MKTSKKSCDFIEIYGYSISIDHKNMYDLEFSTGSILFYDNNGFCYYTVDNPKIDGKNICVYKIYYSEYDNLKYSEKICEFVGEETYKEIYMFDKEKYYYFHKKPYYSSPLAQALGKVDYYTFVWYSYSVETGERLNHEGEFLEYDGFIENYYTKRIPKIEGGVFRTLKEMADKNEYDKLKEIKMYGYNAETKSYIVEYNYHIEERKQKFLGYKNWWENINILFHVDANGKATYLGSVEEFVDQYDYVEKLIPIGNVD